MKWSVRIASGTSIRSSPSGASAACTRIRCSPTAILSCARSGRRSSSDVRSSALRISGISVHCCCCGKASRSTSPAIRAITCCSARSVSVASIGLRRTHSLAALNGDLARLADLDDVSQLLEEIEPDGKGAPVLLRQYLKLGGRLACFNVDETFSGVVDGLIVVDLLRTEPKVLQKYMGREQAAAFIQYAREQPRALADTHAVS
jgi:hypothetical protein